MKTKSLWFLILTLVLALIVLRPFPPEFPETLNLNLRQPADEFQSWLILNRGQNPIFTGFFVPLTDFLDSALTLVEDALLALPALTLILGIILFAYRIAGLRIAVLSGGCLLLMGLFDLWDESMQTLSLILLSVLFSLLIGIPIGIWMALSKRVESVLRSLLDTMQTLPTFVYLVPTILIFGVGGVPSLIATMIYAIPPVARLTWLGLSQVPHETVEAALAFGSTPRQVLFKVQLPLALPSIMAGVNQTIMMALSMVVITALIGANGLGRETLSAMRRLRVGQAFEAGVAIVAMSVVLDRLSYALSKVEPRSHYRFAILSQRLRDAVRGVKIPQVRRYFYGLSLLALIVSAVLLHQSGRDGFPEDWRWSVREPVDNAVEWVQDNLYEIEGTPFGTGPFSDFVTLSLLLPLRDLLLNNLSWLAVILLTVILGWAVSGWRLALLTLVSLFGIGLLGMWEFAMDTLSQVIVAVLLSIAIGIPLGILAARFRAVEVVLRPLLDTLQTIPTFVYLVPMIMFFDLGRVPGVLASIIYALPPVIRLTTLGIRHVDETVIEAAQAFGSSPMQTLFKVQLPLALPSIMTGVNQTLMMVLAMVVVAGLIGSGGLGFEIVSAVADNELGRGLEAGLALVLLAVVLDRITQNIACL
ncbi:MAG: ABC transporter permease subunit [Burkholderiales bacterium]|nr:ABC transporter permease subunit [Anaerolineae bacterium]